MKTKKVIITLLFIIFSILAACTGSETSGSTDEVTKGIVIEDVPTENDSINNERDSLIYDAKGYDQYGYNRDGYDQEGYNKSGLNKNNMDRYGNIHMDWED